MSEKISKLEFLPHTDNQPAGRPKSGHYVDLYSSCELKIADKNCVDEFSGFLVHFRENSRTKKHETTRYHNAKLNQTRPNMTVPMRRETASEKKL